MGQTPSQFDAHFRSGDFTEIVQQLAMLRGDPASDQLLQRTPTSEEWNILSLLCQQERISVEQVAHARGRLLMLWADGLAPRKCVLSSMILALVHFVEAALGGTNLSNVAAALANMAGNVASEMDVAVGLNWATRLASMTPAMAWNEMTKELNQLDPEHDATRAWAASLVMACYCLIAVQNGGNTSPSSSNASSGAVRVADARAMAFYSLGLALRSKEPQAPNRIADLLWEMVQQQELASSLATVDCEYHPAPVVKTWDDIPKAFVGQPHAVREVGDLLRAKREGLLPADKPTVLLFFGPSGHGKTELARWIARVVHKSDDPEATKDLLVLNMANYCTETSLYSLIDPPAGIVGEGGLIKSIQKQPHLVIVADEFEKSTALAVNNLWLPAFESNGKLASGKDPLLKVPTKDITFVLTCNLCDNEIASAAGTYHEASDDGKRLLRQRWIDLCGKRLCEILQNNAFLPRISRLIPFVPFTRPELQRYVSLQIESFQRHNLMRGVEFYYSRAVVERLAEKVRNFHTRSVQDALLRPMLQVSDAGADSVLVTVRTPHPLRSSVSAAVANAAGTGSSGNSDSKDFVATFAGSKEIAGIGGADAEKIAGWAREHKLRQKYDAYLRAAAESKQQAEETQRKAQQHQQQENETKKAQLQKLPQEQQKAAVENSVKQTQAATAEHSQQQQQREPNRQQSQQAQPIPREIPSAQSESRQQQPALQFQLEEKTDIKQQQDVQLNKDLVVNLQRKVQLLTQENQFLKTELKRMEQLISSLQYALAFALVWGFACAVLMCFFVPFKLVLLTTMLVFAAASYFIANFFDILVATMGAVWRFLGPKNVAAIVLVCLVYSYFMGHFYAPVPCERFVA